MVKVKYYAQFQGIIVHIKGVVFFYVIRVLSPLDMKHFEAFSMSTTSYKEIRNIS